LSDGSGGCAWYYRRRSLRSRSEHVEAGIWDASLAPLSEAVPERLPGAELRRSLSPGSALTDDPEDDRQQRYVPLLVFDGATGQLLDTLRLTLIKIGDWVQRLTDHVRLQLDHSHPGHML
jgi:hypothetical protein